MNTQAAHELVRTLPADSVAYRPTPPVFGRKDKNQPLAPHTRWAEATNDRQWASRIAVNYHQSEQPLPPSIPDQNIRRGYRYLQGNRDDQMAMAHSIRTSLDSGMIREVLQGFLCARDISLEGIASLLELDVSVVKLYEGLFFNVRNRGGDFTIKTIFPQTRLGAVREAELDYNEVDLMLMRVGRDYGWKAVAQLAGLLSVEDGDESVETILADIERTMAANARMLARAGHLNRPNSPGIRHGKSLMMRAKKEAELNLGNDPDSRLGLGSFGMKASVLEHFRPISDSDTDFRLALQREAAMGQLAKTAAVAKDE